MSPGTVVPLLAAPLIRARSLLGLGDNSLVNVAVKISLRVITKSLYKHARPAERNNSAERPIRIYIFTYLYHGPKHGNIWYILQYVKLCIPI